MEPISEKRSHEAKKAAWPLWKKLAIAGAVLVTIVVIAVGVGVGVARNRGGNNDDKAHHRRDDISGRAASVWRPRVGATWQIILRTRLNIDAGNISPDVEVYDIDMYENSAETIKKLQDAGKKVICYFSAGSYENWRADKGSFKDGDMGKELEGWPGERWLKLSSENVRNIMAVRIKYAADKGCDSIDPDNVDGFQNDNGLGLTADDSISFVTFLAGEAAKYNMSIGLKNAADIIPTVLNLMDFSVNEQCAEKHECERFSPFIAAGKPVFHIEYPNGAPNIAPQDVNSVCSRTGNSKGADGFSTVMKLMNLNPWVQYCDGKIYGRGEAE
ncbi:hypothetical protein TOPH_08948 [Tolypocladium ophioglossoides CBS 100239]|uniref:alpha-galactosidase n=1 Tax=Tolypocladium ophioglossoides (strain CBS 100239) TaxID=1163406 RepID=A0A0L0MX66_TOLOC|nr:hypothetical protein TOPH_08948 [Tolypocladium ophioglossoides CBS 100239]